MKKFLLLVMVFISKPVLAENLEVFGIDVLHLQLIEMEKAMQSQTNTIEKLTHKLNQLQTQMDTFKADTEIRFEEIQKKEEAVKKEIKTEIEEKKPVSASDSKEIYDAGMELIRSGKYAEAQLKFDEFLKIDPKNKLAGNAKYWLGESYYARNDYTNAAVIFAQGFQEYPDSIKAADNLLKLGISMKALKKNDEACTAFTNVAKEFPKADKQILEKAKNEAKKLKCK